MTEESEVTKITYTNGNRKFSIIQIEFNISRSKQIVAHITSFGMHKSSHTIGMQKNKRNKLTINMSHNNSIHHPTAWNKY